MDLKTAYSVGQNVFLQINDAVAAAVVNEIMPAINASGITINYKVALADGTTQTLPEADVYATAEAVPVPAPQQTDEPVQTEEQPGTAGAAPAKPAPYVGMTCLFTPSAGNRIFTEKKPHAAIISGVNADGTVNLHAFHDGIGGMNWVKKVPAAANAAGPGNWDYVSE